MRVLVCGSRTYESANIPTDSGDTHIPEWAMLAGLWTSSAEAEHPFTLIEGGAKGADSMAHEWASVGQDCGFGLTIERYDADWDKHGGRAGPMRNSRMLREGKPDVVLAFIDKPLEESRGTLDMVTKARAKGVPTYVIRRY